MNNRFLFSGKREDNGEWVEGYYVFQRKRSGAFGQVISELDHDRHLIIDVRGRSHEVIPETVGQCTGLTDKNGKMIFEGDIIKHNGEYGKIVYYDRRMMFIIEFESWWEDCNHVAAYEIEAIGNIHDNPELLEVKR